MAVKFNVTTGYKAFSTTLSFVFDITLSSLLLVMAAPFFIVISIAIKVTDGGPVFYRGERMGRFKIPYTMYKFRSLVPDAERIIGAELLTSQRDIVTKVGRFLRETRLDELPQLYNILNGTMTFIGPRPERAAIYEKFCKDIKGYDKRFLVKPGLIGYSQLFTPHNTSKRLRTLVDNMYIAKRQNVLVDYILVFYTAYLSVKYTVVKIIPIIWRKLLLHALGKSTEDKRYLERVYLDNGKVFYGTNEQFTEEGVLVNINEDAFLMYTDKHVSHDEAYSYKLEIFSKKKKTAFCGGVIFKEYDSGDKDFKHAYVINYKPASPLNAYMIHQYFLQKSVAQI
ncbi:sugar transferase [Candidatus Magnetominusculus xianensis]|uniref:Undecaprenyl-phosphate galactosephosphotransferase n=1 Tax=Candidatus Magnetominusculus xianensis TaxID=1748249 RepID=A0ABR5SDF8_9BACT|nr:sugar transferase [Candidatus Magnetominusculus xianensis]KWT82980.1 putative undecaprenyl-phosphate galactosephosphotransferase [Candidatus Magnetominusculus xianensis]MBF0403059.1 sugar transferase [Nitrospirota bacterium]